MTATKVTRKVYSAEELHRLRGSQSQPKLHEAIEERDAEDAEIVKGEPMVFLSSAPPLFRQWHCKQCQGFPHITSSFRSSLGA